VVFNRSAINPNRREKMSTKEQWKKANDEYSEIAASECRRDIRHDLIQMIKHSEKTNPQKWTILDRIKLLK
jgi:hypothetical protein